jgi:hypothetical protein
MNKRDCTPRLVWFTLSVVVATLGLGLVPQFELFGMSFERVDILSELRADESEVVEYEADIERLEQELAAMQESDTLVVADSLPVLPPVRYEWNARSEELSDTTDVRVPSLLALLPHRPSSAKLRHFVDECSVAIEDFDTVEVSRFDRFVNKLALGEGVRIAFMGDSFVEGDILTSDLREQLQSVFGGRGVGFVACDIPFATVRRTVKRTSSGWSAYSVMKPKSAPQDVSDKFFVSGYVAKGGEGASTRWSVTDAFEHLDSATRARVLLYSRDTSCVRITLNDTIVNEIEVAGYDHMREIYVEASKIDNIAIRVLQGSVLCYGVTLEEDKGVVLDNFSVRSNNGHAIFGTGAAINREIDEILGYDLVVLQYGLNIMQKGQRGYSSYRKQLCDMIAYAERCFPNAAILVLGVSDRWVKNEESGRYEPIGSVDALTAHQRAAADSTKVAFWNMSKAMASLGGMPTFVANGWAANDYTHINFAGGRRIAKQLARAIIAPVCERVETLEFEAMRNAPMSLPAESELLHNVDLRIEGIAPYVESRVEDDVDGVDK